MLDAARTVFLREGFEGASMDRIAAQAGVSKRTIYNNFADKEALFGAVVERIWSGLRFDDAAEALPEDDFAEALRRIANRTLDTLLDPEVIGLLRIVVAESSGSSSLAEAFYHRAKSPSVRRLTEYFRHLDASGRLRIPDPELAAAQFLGLIKEALFWPRLLGVELPLAERNAPVVEEAIRMFEARYRS